jgi:hypothetical protein
LYKFLHRGSDAFKEGQKERVAMTVEQILTTDTETSADKLRRAFPSVLVDEEWQGRRVKLSKTDTQYVLIITNPDRGLYTVGAIDIIEGLKSHLLHLQRASV